MAPYVLVASPRVVFLALIGLFKLLNLKAIQGRMFHVLFHAVLCLAVFYFNRSVREDLI